MIDIKKTFKEQAFAKSSVDDVLISPRIELAIIHPKKTEENRRIYKTFYDNLSLYLSKLPNNQVKKQILNLYNKKIIYLGLMRNPSLKSNIAFESVLIENSNFYGVMLNTSALDIDIITGETDEIDDCVYAAYYSVLRAGILSNKLKIKNDKQLHKLLSTYLYLMILKFLGKNTLYSKRQKQLIHMCCIYIYYVYFFNQNHSYSINVIKRDFLDNIDIDVYKEFQDLMKENKGYDTIKDLPKLLFDLKLSFEDPRKVYVKMFQILGTNGFYSFIGPFDHFAAAMILSKYPTSLFSKAAIAVMKIHDASEMILNKYIDKLKFKKMSL